jgi:hypothetical protein
MPSICLDESRNLIIWLAADEAGSCRIAHGWYANFIAEGEAATRGAKNV